MGTSDLSFFPLKSGGFDRFYDWYRHRATSDLATLASDLAALDVRLTTAESDINNIESGATDLTTYFKLAGRAGGQTAYGDTASGGNLTLGSTAHATKGKILLGSSSAYDEANTRLGIGTASPGATLDVRGAAIFNEAGGDVDFRVEGDTNASLLFIDASTDRVGIGTASPAEALDATSTADVAYGIQAKCSHTTGTTANGFLRAAANTAQVAVIAHGDGRVATRYGITLGGYGEILNGAGNGLIIGTSTANPVVFGANNVERLRLDSTGNYLFGGAAVGTSGVGVLSLKNGTAPTTGPADCLQIYSTDNSAGHTLLSWRCEGTETVVTGSADVASGNRVRVRVNGTVYQLLAV